MSTRWIIALFGVAIVVSAASFLTAVFPITIDDGFIPARYAEQLGDGHGLVYNVGERINMLTSPLHALIESGLYLTTGATITANKIAAILAVNAALLAAVWSLREPSERLLFAVLTFPSPFLLFWTVGGLETPYLTALITTLVVLVRSVQRRTQPMLLALASLVMGLTFVCRYDSVFLLVPCALYLLLKYRFHAIQVVLPGLLVAGGWLLFAQWYYHDILPVSFYEKTPKWIGDLALNNALYTEQFFVLSGTVFLSLMLFPALMRPEVSLRKAIVEFAGQDGWLCVGLALVFGYGLTCVTTHMMFSYRLLVPYLPALVWALLDFRRQLLVQSERASRALYPAFLIGAAAMGVHVWMMVTLLYKTMNPSLVDVEFQNEGVIERYENFHRTLRLTAADIREHWKTQPASRDRMPRICTITAGIVPYYYRDTYVYETIGINRKQCRCGVAVSSDYLHSITIIDGMFKHRFGWPAAELELVSSYPLTYNGIQNRMHTYFLNSPEPNRLPPMVDQPCLTVEEQTESPGGTAESGETSSRHSASSARGRPAGSG